MGSRSELFFKHVTIRVAFFAAVRAMQQALQSLRAFLDTYLFSTNATFPVPAVFDVGAKKSYLPLYRSTDSVLDTCLLFYAASCDSMTSTVVCLLCELCRKCLVFSHEFFSC